MLLNIRNSILLVDIMMFTKKLLKYFQAIKLKLYKCHETTKINLFFFSRNETIDHNFNFIMYKNS